MNECIITYIMNYWIDLVNSYRIDFFLKGEMRKLSPTRTSLGPASPRFIPLSLMVERLRSSKPKQKSGYPWLPFHPPLPSSLSTTYQQASSQREAQVHAISFLLYLTYFLP
nr:hypothetical protein Q903MT_gene4653 [Picea sitchensis]